MEARSAEAVWALHIDDLFTDVSVSHGPALSVQAGAGAGVGVVKTHGVHCPPRCTG